jgi:hypothetical protein
MSSEFVNAGAYADRGRVMRPRVLDAVAVSTPLNFQAPSRVAVVIVEALFLVFKLFDESM